MFFLYLNPKPESFLGILRLFMKVQSLTNTNQVSDLSGMSFPYVPALCAGLRLSGDIARIYKLLLSGPLSMPGYAHAKR